MRSLVLLGFEMSVLMFWLRYEGRMGIRMVEKGLKGEGVSQYARRSFVAGLVRMQFVSFFDLSRAPSRLWVELSSA